jgi:hypothetical protein
MKNLSPLFFLAFFFYSNYSFTQVDDIGIAFSYEEAYIDEMDSQGALVISYLDKGKEIHTHTFSIDPLLIKKQNLRNGSMISFSGEEFIETDKKIIQVVKLKSGFPEKKKIIYKNLTK